MIARRVRDNWGGETIPILKISHYFFFFQQLIDVFGCLGGRQSESHISLLASKLSKSLGIIHKSRFFFSQLILFELCTIQ